MASKAFGAWQHEAPAKRSGSVYRLTALEQRQAIMQRQDLWFVCLDVCDLQGFGDTSKVSLLECSLSCDSERIPWVVARNVSLELWLEIGVKHMAFLGCGSEWHLLSCGSRWRMNTGNSWVVARVGVCYRCESASCGSYGWVQI